MAGPGMIPALASLVGSWCDPNTGFFGVTYVVDGTGHQVATRDLSLTFHMIRYLPHLVADWPRLVDTLLELSETAYPQGRLNPDPKPFSDHNNYDVAEILRRGWRRMLPRQRVRASELIGAMFDWCVSRSVAPDGTVIDPDTGDMVPDAYYFCAAFLDTVGYFDRTKRFWTDRDLGDARRVRRGMADQLAKFNPRLSVVADARERLGFQHRPTSNAVL